MKQDLNQQPTVTIGRPRAFHREEALKVAMLTFWQHGYETTSMSLLSKKMKMSAPSIYATFGDKKGLFLEALDLYVGDLNDMKMFLDQSTSAFEGASQLLKMSAYRFTDNSNPCGCMLASSAASGSSDSKDVQKITGQFREKIENLIQHRIEQDIKKGRLAKSTSAEALATLTVATIQGMSVLARDGASRKKLIQLAETAMRAWGSKGFVF